jgi:hypothetical protein
MAKIPIKNGTPLHGQSLCKTCVHGHWQKGFRESEEAVFCVWGWEGLRRIPFAVAECTHFTNKLVPSVASMEQIATILPVSRRVAGFGIDTEEDGDREAAIVIP